MQGEPKFLRGPSQPLRGRQRQALGATIVTRTLDTGETCSFQILNRTQSEGTRAMLSESDDQQVYRQRSPGPRNYPCIRRIPLAMLRTLLNDRAHIWNRLKAAGVSAAPFTWAAMKAACRLWMLSTGTPGRSLWAYLNSGRRRFRRPVAVWFLVKPPALSLAVLNPESSAEWSVGVIHYRRSHPLGSGSSLQSTNCDIPVMKVLPRISGTTAWNDPT